MRISDWSSDVCSSDLRSRSGLRRGLGRGGGRHGDGRTAGEAERLGQRRGIGGGIAVDAGGDHGDADLAVQIVVERRTPDDVRVGIDQFADMVRSAEHTSELQSLMRNSYAFYFLKNNN